MYTYIVLYKDTKYRPIDRQKRPNFLWDKILCETNSYWLIEGPSLELQLPVQSVPITTKVVSSNPAHGEVYSIQQYVIKFVSVLQQIGGFLQFPPPIKLTTTI